MRCGHVRREHFNGAFKASEKCLLRTHSRFQETSLIPFEWRPRLPRISTEGSREKRARLRRLNDVLGGYAFSGPHLDYQHADIGVALLQVSVVNLMPTRKREKRQDRRSNRMDTQ